MLKKIDHCNIEAMTGVRDMILTVPPHRFDMTSYCGTAFCIAGHAVAWDALSRVDEGDVHRKKARDILGLSYDTAQELFVPSNEGLDWTTITPAHAAQAMDNVVMFDDPKWEEVMA